jgi:hypothetical protein
MFGSGGAEAFADRIERAGADIAVNNAERAEGEPLPSLVAAFLRGHGPLLSMWMMRESYGLFAPAT